jgi:hypothetical protein
MELNKNQKIELFSDFYYFFISIGIMIIRKKIYIILQN